MEAAGLQLWPTYCSFSADRKTGVAESQVSPGTPIHQVCHRNSHLVLSTTSAETLHWTQVDKDLVKEALLLLCQPPPPRGWARLLSRMLSCK